MPSCERELDEPTEHPRDADAQRRRCTNAALPSARSTPDRGQPPGPGRDPLRDVRRSCSTTASCRPRRSASWCCTCSAPRPRSGSRSRTGSARRCRWSSTSRISRRTVSAGACTSPTRRTRRSEQALCSSRRAPLVRLLRGRARAGALAGLPGGWQDRGRTGSTGIMDAAIALRRLDVRQSRSPRPCFGPMTQVIARPTLPAIEVEHGLPALRADHPREAANFYYGIRLLPRDKRQGDERGLRVRPAGR